MVPSCKVTSVKDDSAIEIEETRRPNGISATEDDSVTLLEEVDQPDIKEQSGGFRLLERFDFIPQSVPTPFKNLLFKNVSNHRAVSLTVCNVLLILTLVCLTGGSKPSHDCILTPHKQLLEQCEPFKPVSEVTLRYAPNSSYSCYNTKTCLDVVEAEVKDENSVPDFIIGLHGFVYVGSGYHCAPRNSTLLIEMTADNPRDFKLDEDTMNIVKLREVVYEGLRCGKIHKDFKLKITNEVKEHYQERAFNGLTEDQLRDKVVGRHRKPWTDNSRQGEIFNLLDKRRVYNKNYRIFACEERKN